MVVRARVLGFTVAVLGLAIDQAHKAWMLGPFAIEEKGRVPLAPFLDLVMVWNRGISYGLFAEGGSFGRWILVLLGCTGAVLFGWWLWGTRGRLAAISLGFIVAGAFSNVIDRLVYGAVADFFLFHVGAFEWYVFNFADVWIVAGAVGLVFAWATERREMATEA